jgi:hypothetical protein
MQFIRVTVYTLARAAMKHHHAIEFSVVSVEVIGGLQIPGLFIG